MLSTYRGPFGAPKVTGVPPLALIDVVMAAWTFPSVPLLVSPPIRSAMTRAPASAAKSDAFWDARRCSRAVPPSMTRPDGQDDDGEGDDEQGQDLAAFIASGRP